MTEERARTNEPRGPGRDHPSPLRGRLRSLLAELGRGLLWVVGIAVVLTALFRPFFGNAAPLHLTFLLNLVVTTSMASCCVAGFHLVFDPLNRRLSHPIATVLLYSATTVGAVALGTEIATRVLGWLGFRQTWGDLFQVALVVTVIITLISLAYEGLTHRLRTTERRAARAEEHASAARLQALQARTDPHFLFNSLNTAAGLVSEDPVTAERTLEKMSSLFRYVLEGSRSEFVRFGDEIAMVEDYLAIERLRLGERLRTRIEIDLDTHTTWIPPLVLQPLVENAVLHGIAPRPGGGELAVRARHRDDHLHLVVENDGPRAGDNTASAESTTTRSRTNGSGTALQDLRARLELVYEGRARLHTTTPEAGGFRVELDLPVAGAIPRSGARSVANPHPEVDPS